MSFDFVSSPAVGNQTIVNDRIWQWNGSGWFRVINAGQIVSTFQVIPVVEVLVTYLPSPIGAGFVLTNYV